MDIAALQQTYNTLQQKVEKAEQAHQPIDEYVTQQIKILEEIHDEFVSSMISENAEVERSLDFQGLKIKQLQAISSLCKKIGLPTDKYDKEIREIRVKTFGADFVNERYGKTP